MRVALAALLLVLAGAGLSRQAEDAKAVGEGIFQLDKTEYFVPEGTAFPVVIERTDGAVLTEDVQVILTVDALTEFDIPSAEATKLVTFPKGTNFTSRTVLIQTLNKEQFEDRQIQVTILSVSQGGLIGPRSTAPVTLLGTGTPRVFSVNPESGGSYAGQGTILLVTGENFIVTGATITSVTTAVEFWPFFSPSQEVSLPVPGTEVEVLSQTQLRVRVPALSSDYAVLAPNQLAATYDIRVKVLTTPPQVPFPDFLSARSAGSKFVYTTGPTVRDVTPRSGPPTGGTVVLVRGTQLPPYAGTQPIPCFSIGVQVDIGNQAVVDCDLVGTNLLRVETPPRTAGLVDVVVRVGGIPSPETNQSNFSYTGAPVITALEPSFGPESGGTRVIIRGSNFFTQNEPPAAVLFGGNAAEFDLITDNLMEAIAPPGSGVQQVTVIHNVGGTSPFRTEANYTYSSGPLINSIEPDRGPSSGGTSVTIRGTGFTAGAVVKFNDVIVPSIFTNSTTLMTVSPPGGGIATVSVTVAGNVSLPGPQTQFIYDGPSVTSISPIAGPVLGGTAVTIKGTNFTTTSIVHFNNIVVTPVFVDTQTLTVVTPPMTGAVHIRVTTASGQSPEVPEDIFTFTSGPIVDALNPTSGPTTGATIVVITGKNFLAPLSIKFGENAATSFNINSATQITVLSPPSAVSGAVDVRVTKGVDTSPVGPMTKFTYGSATPKITAITPNSGTTFGGTEITITGLGLSGAVCPGAVRFGAVPAPSCVVVNDTTITTVAPPNVAGPTVVTVNTANGTSEIIQNFTYVSPNTPGGPTTPPPPGAGGTQSYTLTARWTLLTWTGLNNANIQNAVRGTGVPGATDLSSRISAFYLWDSQSASYKAYFTGAEGIPGANDLTHFVAGAVYWVAILGTGQVQWVVNVP